MNPQPPRPSVRVGDPAGLLAIVPHLLGFTPQTSLVVLGAGPPDGRVQVALRYDLPAAEQAEVRVLRGVTTT